MATTTFLPPVVAALAILTKTFGSRPPATSARPECFRKTLRECMVWLQGCGVAAPHPAFGHLLPASGEKATVALAPRSGERVPEGRVRGATPQPFFTASGIQDCRESTR